MSKLRRRVTIAALSALGAMLVLPAAGQAATNFGSRLQNEPANAGECMALGPCSMVSFIHPSDPNGDPYAGGAPIDGVITKFRIRGFPEGGSGNASATFIVADIERPNPADESTALASRAGGIGPTITVPEPPGVETPILEIGGRLPVKKGQHLGVDASPNLWATYNNSGDEYSYIFAPPLVEGAGKRGSTQSTGELLVAGTIEPDADNDGFGDETQDRCPRQASTQGDCDDTKPGVQNLKVQNGTATYSLSEAATVTLLLEKKQPGRRVGKSCVKQTPKNKTKKRCAKFKQIATFPGGGSAGANTVALPNGKKLKPGRYRLTLTARDAAGNETTVTTTFVVKKKKKKKK
jgi:hypothetical protein